MRSFSNNEKVSGHRGIFAHRIKDIPGVLKSAKGAIVGGIKFDTRIINSESLMALC